MRQAHGLNIVRLIICLTLFFNLSLAQWSELVLPQRSVPAYSTFYPSGDDCMIFAVDTSNTIYGFDQNSKVWSEFTANTTLDWESSYGGGKVCMILNDSIAVAYNSVNSQFKELRYEGTLVPLPGSAWSNCGKSYGVIMTTERIYIYDAELNDWTSVAMVDYGLMTGHSNYLADDFMYVMMAFSDYDTRLVCYSLRTKTIDEVTKYNFSMNRLDHGVCGLEYSSASYIIGYSAYTGVFSQIDNTDPDRFFQRSVPDTDNDRVSELVLCMFHKNSDMDANGYVTYTDYVYNTLTGSFYSDSYTCKYVSTGFYVKVGGKFTTLAVYDIMDYKVNLRIFRASDNSFYGIDVPIYIIANTPGLLTVGEEVFWIWDDTHLLAVNATTGAMGQVVLNDSFATTPSVMVNLAGNDWGVWGYRNTGSDTVKIFYFSGDVTDIRYKEEYASLGVSDAQYDQIGYIMFQDPGDLKKWSAYSPSHNAWHDFEQTTSGSQTIVGNYMFVNYSSAARLELFDGVTNEVHIYPYVSSYTYMKYEKEHLVFYNEDKQYIGYSAIEHDDQIFQADKYYGLLNSGYIALITPYGPLLNTYTRIIYDGYRNNLAGLKIPDSLGTTISGRQTGKFCYFATSTGHVFAYTGEEGNVTQVEREQIISPKQFSLNQNYPNPFNPSTTIEFTLAEKSDVTLKIFDLLGREVATLVDGERSAGVLYKEIFDASKLSTGIYFYRLQTEKGSLVKKLMLVR